LIAQFEIERMNNLVKEIEESIMNVVSDSHFTANQLAVCNVFYNLQSGGISLNELAKRIGRKGHGQIGGILSKLAQKIDRLENPSPKYGFSGYVLFFEQLDEDKLKIRPEFRVVIDRHQPLKEAMQITIERVYLGYKDGLDL
jgi:hypothetical protein